MPFAKPAKSHILVMMLVIVGTLARFNKSDIVGALMVEVDDDMSPDDCDADRFQNMAISSGNCVQATAPITTQLANVPRVEAMKSPNFICYYKNFPCKVTIDTGATSNIVSLAFVQSSGMTLSNTSQGAKQLDGSRVKTCGEVDVVLDFGREKLRLIALVVESADTDILGGIPFCKRNSIEVCIKNDELYVRDKIVKYGQGPQPKNPRIFKADSILLRSDAASVIYPGEVFNVSCNELSDFDGDLALEPRSDSPAFGSWPQPSLISVEKGVLAIPNCSNELIRIRKKPTLGKLTQGFVCGLER